MKKIIAMLLAVMMVLAMVACAAKQAETTTEAPAAAETTTETTETAEPVEETATEAASEGKTELNIGVLVWKYSDTYGSSVRVAMDKYAKEIGAKLEEAGVRVVVDERDEKIGYKIREARGVDRVPYMLILGEQERDGGYISVRDRSNETVQSSLEDFLDKIGTEIAERL